MGLSKKVSVAMVASMSAILVVSWTDAKSASTESKGKVVATYNGTSLYERDLELALTGMTEGQKQVVLKDSSARRELIVDLINQKILAGIAKKRKLDQTPQYKEMMERDSELFLANAEIDDEVTPLLTPAAVKKFYEANKDKFNNDQVRVQHILLSDEAEARKILALAKDSSNDFQDLAEKYSKDPSAKNNRGDIGLIPRGRMVAEFDDVAFTTPVGKVVGPVKTAFGYHIIKVVQRMYGEPIEFNNRVEIQARMGLRQQLIRNIMADKKTGQKIEILDR